MYCQVYTVCVCHSSLPTHHQPPPWSVSSLLRRSYMQTRLRLAAAESRHKLRLCAASGFPHCHVVWCDN